ncbi:MAG: CBS domain-containing protein [Planctomycetota bacterium]|jgi:CBS domain-containing protein/gamma-glutamylcysteine synthetase
MGEHSAQDCFDEEQLRTFMKALLADVRVLELMLDEGKIESGTRRIGAEQEMFLVDSAGRPALKAMQVIERLQDPAFTTELALFNLELNLDPHLFGGDCLQRTERELIRKLEQARNAARAEDCAIVLTGILPTLNLNDLSLDSMTPMPRYRALNDVMSKLRGGEFSLKIRGIDDIDASHDNVMLEACNTSFQIHFQTGPDEFARLYNLAQAITAPVLAAAVNSPLLLGKRLWEETRVALFEQSVDARSKSHQSRGLRPRVHFGEAWVDDSILEIFREDIARFRVVLAAEQDEDPEKVLRRGEIPKMSALRMHNGTVYRWNRPCYGVHNGVAHLRIENRVLPAGPSVVDEMANAAFFFGLMSALAEEYGEITKVMDFDAAKANFRSAARHGLRAQFKWLDGREISAANLILEELLPLARQGLEFARIDSSDCDRYLGVLQDRVEARQTGANWLLDSFDELHKSTSKDRSLCTLTQVTIARQKGNLPVHEWPSICESEADTPGKSFLRVEQFMTTDLFTVRPEDVIDLAASLMDWRHVRHVPVEDDEGRLVGLVSHRSLLRLMGQGMAGKGGENVSVAKIMKADPVSVPPHTLTLDAIETMRKNKVGCLPIVDKGHLVGIITERDLIGVAAQIFEQHLRELTDQ